MAKKRPGLPAGFNINVSEELLDGPVQLGDYLDEEEAPRRAPDRPANQEPAARSAPEFEPAEEGASTTPSPEAPRSQPLRAVAPRPPSSPPSGSRRAPAPKKPERTQVNMSAETIRMQQELLNFIQTYSVQKDAKLSEFYEALITALWEARSHVDLSNVRPRGRWGTPTARAFPVQLKNAFQEAITSYRIRKDEEDRA